MNEIGVDPGIDHMSAMQVIDRVKAQGGEMTAFYSYCGGLVAPESNDNPWGYKFSWNPRNVILAGQGTARFIENGENKFLSHSQVFAQAKSISVEGLGNFDATQIETRFPIVLFMELILFQRCFVARCA